MGGRFTRAAGGPLIPEARQLTLPYVAFLLVVLQALPLTWRRWPIAVFFAVGIPRSLYDQLGIGFAPLPPSGPRPSTADHVRLRRLRV